MLRCSKQLEHQRPNVKVVHGAPVVKLRSGHLRVPALSVLNHLGARLQAQCIFVAKAFTANPDNLGPWALMLAASWACLPNKYGRFLLQEHALPLIGLIPAQTR